MTPEHFQETLLAWYDRFGRKHLPWQQPRTPYRVWISEIMLQQTQVATVERYFRRFVAVFPDVTALARAHPDQVLQLWSGLGYYHRAQHLHRAARIIMERHSGTIPDRLEALMALPGIGRSTAGAIISLAFDRPAPILDGNVKRLWCRLHGIDTWPGETSTQKRLWQLSETYLPRQRSADYTQALMDFGATVCTRSQPACFGCPFQGECFAYRSGRVDRLPARRPVNTKPVRTGYWLLLQTAAGEVYLEKRSPAGIWPGLWALPQWDRRHELEAHCRLSGLDPAFLHWLPPRRHTFTHFHLDYVVAIGCLEKPIRLNDVPARWIQPDRADELALPAPVKKLLDEVNRRAVVI